jgi:hypothetical protein
MRDFNGMGDADGILDGDLFGPEGRADHDFAPAFPQPTRREGPGRPPGAANRKTLQLQRLYVARGFRDPLLGMGELVTSDPVELWRWMRQQTKAETGSLEGAPSLLDVVKLQQAARSDLAPYLHGKAPQQTDTGDEALPVLIVDLGDDQVAAARRKAADEALSIGQAVEEAEIVENQRVSDDGR